ncbi:DUF3052 domain-containing protein [Propionibacterium australiense]|uniref:DUF3052 domain-containing protein n=2 Tax=Propionibacterium australiense TaxID=119981 RepID=A0A383S463_9ACTN|nr:Protein of unknown function DUF3052 [Propionibacterium australiense]VEH90145.1 Protein of uncharacterised function (DUF3052) [Propionibacterium australiense]
MAGSTDKSSTSMGGAELLKLRPGMVVQELGWDDDVDEDLRADIMDEIDADLIEDAVEAVDAVILWQRDDTDVADALVDALRDLSDTGYIWLLTPKIGRPGYVKPIDVSEGASVAGLTATGVVEVSPDWQACRIVRSHTAHRS